VLYTGLVGHPSAIVVVFQTSEGIRHMVAEIKNDQQPIFHSPYPTIEISDVSLVPHVLRCALEFGDKPALIDGPSGRTITYKQLVSDVRHAAAGLAQRGFSKGDVFAIFSPNLPEFAVAFLSATSIGGIITTINPLANARELADQLRDSKATHLVTIPQLLNTAREAATEAGSPHLWVFGEAEGATPFSTLLENEGEPPVVEINPREDLAVLPYSSGTTGLPKGVMLTHYNLVAHDEVIDGTAPLTSDDVLIAILPFFHIYGMSVIMNAGLSRGATIVTMPRFDLDQFLQLLQDYRVTCAYLVPPIVLALAKHPLVDNYDLSSLQTICSGAAPLGADFTRACAERLGCAMNQGYGMTEASPVTHVGSGEWVKDGSIGVCVRNTDARIVDPETGRTLGINEHGELWVRGPQVMKGYLNRPDATAATIVEDGWLRTGDIAYVDEDGYFFVVDRLKELIKYKGYQVAPAELEAILLSHPAVSDAAVIGCVDEEAGEIPKAFVVTKSDVEPGEILAYVAERVAPYKKIRLLEFVDEVPKSASGKILRRVLIEQERERFRA
jgi:acyl-CoA synthetase (AMP-forming)/AMP-acid ligase II